VSLSTFFSNWASSKGRPLRAASIIILGLLAVLIVGCSSGCSFGSPFDGQAKGRYRPPVVVGSQFDGGAGGLNDPPVIGGLQSDGQAAGSYDPPMSAPVFQSNWSAATGTDDSAVLDGGKWDNYYCAPSVRAQVLSVVSGAPHGWTLTPNVMQVTNSGGSFCGKVANQNAIPTTGSYYLRVYVRVTGASGNGNSNHSMSLNGTGDYQAALWAVSEPNNGNTYAPRLRLYENVGGSPHGYGGPTLTQGQWYRFEWHVEYYDPANPLRARIWPRVYDMAGTLVGDASAYRSYAEGPARTLAQDYAAGAYLPVRSRDLARILAMGYEGNTFNDNLAARWYFAGVEARTDRFPGPIQ